MTNGRAPYYNRRTVEVLVAPLVSPVNLNDLKLQLRIEGDSEDALLQMYLESAADLVQSYIGRSLITQTLVLHMDSFGDEQSDYILGAPIQTAPRSEILGHPQSIDLPKPKVQSITSIKTFNRSNVESTFDAASYSIENNSGRLYLNDGYTWPTDLRDRDAVNITYVAGYGAEPCDVPASIRQEIIDHAKKQYECGSGCDLSDSCMRKLSSYRVIDMIGYY